jgi:hypothetical protein
MVFEWFCNGFFPPNGTGATVSDQVMFQRNRSVNVPADLVVEDLNNVFITSKNEVEEWCLKTS